MRHVMIDQVTGYIRNAIELDNDALWHAPEGFTIIPSDTLQIGEIYKEEN